MRLTLCDVFRCSGRHVGARIEALLISSYFLETDLDLDFDLAMAIAGSAVPIYYVALLLRGTTCLPVCHIRVLAGSLCGCHSGLPGWRLLLGCVSASSSHIFGFACKLAMIGELFLPRDDGVRSVLS